MFFFFFRNLLPVGLTFAVTRIVLTHFHSGTLHELYATCTGCFQMLNIQTTFYASNCRYALFFNSLRILTFGLQKKVTESEEDFNGKVIVRANFNVKNSFTSVYIFVSHR